MVECEREKGQRRRWEWRRGNVGEVRDEDDGCRGICLVKDTGTTEIYAILFVGSVRCV